jgi:hypothetical protein
VNENGGRRRLDAPTSQTAAAGALTVATVTRQSVDHARGHTCILTGMWFACAYADTRRSRMVYRGGLDCLTRSHRIVTARMPLRSEFCFGSASQPAHLAGNFGLEPRSMALAFTLVTPFSSFT